MEKSSNFYTPVFVGIVAIIAGALLVAVSGILGIALIAVGVVAVAIPLTKGRAPKVELDGGSLHITGAFADWTIDVSKIRKIRTVDSIKIVVMTMGYGGHRYIGGEFVENSLGGIYIAADKKIPMFIVVDCDDMTYVFNHRDLQSTKELYDRLNPAESEN